MKDPLIVELSYERLRVFVPGVPEPQSRPRIGRGGHVYSPVSSWRKLVAAAMMGLRTSDFAKGMRADNAAVRVTLTFIFQRPQWHYRRSKRDTRTLASSAPKYHVSRPDIDNLIKSTLDAIVDAGVLPNDCRVCELYASKKWLDETFGHLHHESGALIELTRVR